MSCRSAICPAVLDANLRSMCGLVNQKRDSWIMDQETVQCNLTSLSRVEDVEALKLSSVSNVETFEASFGRSRQLPNARFARIAPSMRGLNGPHQREWT